MSAEFPNFCPNCGKSLKWLPGETQCICAGCGQRIVPSGEGVARRFLRRPIRPRPAAAPPGRTRVVRIATESQEFRVQDSATGEVKVYNSIEEMPAEVRERIEALRVAASPAAEKTKYTFRDSSGVERTYHSLDEMPPDVRQMFERARRR
jgi:hypothetical protein